MFARRRPPRHRRNAAWCGADEWRAHAVTGLISVVKGLERAARTSTEQGAETTEIGDDEGAYRDALAVTMSALRTDSIRDARRTAPRRRRGADDTGRPDRQTEHRRHAGVRVGLIGRALRWCVGHHGPRAQSAPQRHPPPDDERNLHARYECPDEVQAAAATRAALPRAAETRRLCFSRRVQFTGGKRARRRRCGRRPASRHGLQVDGRPPARPARRPKEAHAVCRKYPQSRWPSFRRSVAANRYAW